MIINKNRHKRKFIEKKSGGVPIHITHMSVASYHRPSSWVPNQSLDKLLLPNDTICK